MKFTWHIRSPGRIITRITIVDGNRPGEMYGRHFELNCDVFCNKS